MSSVGGIVAPLHLAASGSLAGGGNAALRAEGTGNAPSPCPTLASLPELSAEEVVRFMEAQNRETLEARAVAAGWVILAATAAYSAAKFAFDPTTTASWYGPILGLSIFQLAAVGLVRRAKTTRRLEHLLLASSSLAAIVTAWVGVVAGRTTSSDFLEIGLAMLTASLVPWQPRMQAILVAVIGACVLANAWGVTGALIHSVGFPTLVPVAVVLVTSVYVSRSLFRSRLRSARSELLRARAEAETRELNVMLERRVLERTAELQAANEELEAFSYSVSHDLRAPLRAMDGLSEALLEDYGHVLDDRAQNYLQRVRGEATRLGRLVDDLLQLSRVGRSALQRREVNLSAVAEQVATRIHARQPERDVEVVVEPDLREKCDEALVRVLLENLLDNAFKYSRPQKHARIEFGLDKEGPPRVYFVRDNGIGFDMAHVRKIFGAFERLQRAEDFEGTGIGLATVHRIIGRHGGTIEAEAKPGEGATFRFTLGPAGETS